MKSQDVSNLDEEAQIKFVNVDGRAIRGIDDPSEAVQLAAVKENAFAIEYIIKKGITPSEAVQLAAVQNDVEAFEYIDNPSEEVQLAAVQKDGEAIEYIDNPSEKVKALHMKLYG